VLTADTGGGDVAVAAACMQCCHNKTVNLRKYEAFIDQAAKYGVRLLIFPEVSVQGYLTQRGDAKSPEVMAQLEYYREEAEPVPGPTTERIGQLAAEYNMTIQIGMAERNEVGTVLYNSAVVVGPEGVIGVYRKVHNYTEIPIFRPGNRFSVFDTPIGRIGPFICADLNFPECLRALAIQGASILTMTTAWPMESDDSERDYLGHIYEVQLEAAAVANQVWIIAANQVMRPPTEGAANYYGHSRVVSPFGSVVAGCGYEENLVLARVGIVDEIKRNKRSRGDRIQQRQPSLYSILSDERY